MELKDSGLAKLLWWFETFYSHSQRLKITVTLNSDVNCDSRLLHIFYCDSQISQIIMVIVKI